jgi:hypothetical protein
LTRFAAAKSSETGVKVAIDEFRSESGITDEFQKVDSNCVFWRRSSRDRAS